MAWDSDNVETLPYAEIFERALVFDRSAPIAVLLNRYQAWLFRSKFEMLTHADGTKGFLRGLYDSLRLLCVMGLILTTAPKLAFLSDFYEMDGAVTNRVRFVQGTSGVTVYFLPKEKS